jgi:hypothetical protein
MKGIDMKNISSVISLSFLLLLLLVSCVSSLSNLVKSGNNNYWMNYYDGEYGNFSYKKVNLEKDGGKYIVQVWGNKVISDKGREIVIQFRTENGLSTEGYDKLKESKSFIEIDCKKRMKRELSTHDYNTDGKILYTDSPDKPNWDYIIPDSPMDTLLKKVCK